MYDSVMKILFKCEHLKNPFLHYLTQKNLLFITTILIVNN
jgi:hypothetical protein